MNKYNRRNFFKFIAKGAAIVGAAGVFGLPEVEAKEWEFNVPKYDKSADILNFAECHNVSSVKIPAGFPDDSYPVKFESGYVTAWTTEQRKQFAREVIELEKELPGLMPMWEYELIYDSSGYEAILIDKNLRKVKRYLLSDYLWYGADNFVKVLREDYQKYKVEELKVWADDIENYTTNHYFGGLNEIIQPA